MICKACNKDASSEECFEKALDILKQHYTCKQIKSKDFIIKILKKFANLVYKNALIQRDEELQQIKERNEKLNKALQLLQKKQPPAKRFKSQQTDDSWLSAHNSSQDNVTNSDLSMTDDERLGATNFNIALNSEQLFETSVLSQSKNDVSITTSSEMLQSPQVKESPKRNKQRDDFLRLKRGANRCLEKSKSEWQSKERTSSPVEKSWTMKGLQATKVKEDKGNSEKTTTEKRLKLSLKKTNPSKMKQSLIHFNKSKENSFREVSIGLVYKFF